MMIGISVMLVTGMLAYLIKENGFPVAPTILGIVLATMLEDTFMSSMIKGRRAARRHIRSVYATGGRKRCG